MKGVSRVGHCHLRGGEFSIDFHCGRMILYGKKDHAHVCSRNRFSLPTAYITVLQHERKPSTTGSVVMFLKFPLQPTNLYHDHKMQKLLLHVWCLMLECVSIVAGMIVVSGPSKLEFGDVLAMTARTFVCVIYLLHCVTVTVLLCVCGFVSFFWERERETCSTVCFLAYFMYFQHMLLLQVVEMKLWHDGGGCQFILLGVSPNRCAATAKMFLLDGQLSMYEIIWHLVTLWMVQRALKGNGTTNLS